MKEQVGQMAQHPGPFSWPFKAIKTGRIATDYITLVYYCRLNPS